MIVESLLEHLDREDHSRFRLYLEPQIDQVGQQTFSRGGLREGNFMSAGDISKISKHLKNVSIQTLLIHGRTYERSQIEDKMRKYEVQYPPYRRPPNYNSNFQHFNNSAAVTTSGMTADNSISPLTASFPRGPGMGFSGQARTEGSRTDSMANTGHSMSSLESKGPFSH